MERHKQLVFVLSYLVLLSAVFASSPCDPTLLARMADSCGWDLGKPSETCCQMVVAAVGIGYGDPVPCICLVVEDPDFPATRLNINMILKMYPICDGVLPVGPHIAAVCRGLCVFCSVLFLFLLLTCRAMKLIFAENISFQEPIEKPPSNCQVCLKPWSG